MHSLQSSKSRHNIFARVDHDQNYIKAHNSPKKDSINNNLSEKGQSSPSSLPGIDFHVRKKLATGDLAAKFQSKTTVLNVSSTLGVEGDISSPFINSRKSITNGSSIFDYNDDIDDHESIRSDSSDPSVRLENFKRNLEDSPQQIQGHDDVCGFFEVAFDDDIVEEGSFGPDITSPDFVSISKQDHTQFQSPLDAHKKYMKAVRSRNNMNSLKTVSSRKLIPTQSQKSQGNSSKFQQLSTKSGMSQRDDSSVVSDPSAALGSHRILGAKASSFLFLSSLKSFAPPTILEEKEEDEDTSKRFDGASTVAPFGSNNEADRATSPSAKAPLENTSSPVVPKALRMRSFARFNASAEDNSRLKLRMLDSQKSVTSTKSPDDVSLKKDLDLLSRVTEDQGSVHSASSPNLFPKITNALTPIFGSISSPQSSPATQDDPKKKSLYHVQSLSELRTNKRNFTDWIDEKIRALTFVAAPPKPATPPQEDVPALTVESLFGDSLLHANIDKRAVPISDAAYQKILKEIHDKKKQQIEEKYRLHNLNGSESELINELERDYHYREQLRLHEQQAEDSERHDSEGFNHHEVYSNTYMEPLGVPVRKPITSSNLSAKDETQNPSNLPSMSSLAHPSGKNSSAAVLPKLDLTPVLQRQQHQQQQKPLLPSEKHGKSKQSEDYVPRSEGFLAANSFDLAAQGDDNASVISFSSSITSLPGLHGNGGVSTMGSAVGTRLPSIQVRKPNDSIAKSLFQSPESKKPPQQPLAEEQDRIVFHNPFSTMFAYTSDDIQHYSTVLNPDTKKQLQRLYDTDPTVSKRAQLQTSTQTPLNATSQSIFDINDDLAQPLEDDPNVPPDDSRYTFQHSTTSYVLQDWENYAAKGIPNEQPSFVSDPKLLAQQDHDRIVDAMLSPTSPVINTSNSQHLASKSPSKKRDIDALNVLSATKLDRKLTLEDIDTTYMSLRHQSQVMTYSTTAQQELAQMTNNADARRIYSILNPGPHEAVIFLPPDHAQFAAEMSETFHSLPSGLLALTQDKELMQEMERQTQQVYIPGSEEDKQNSISARKARLQPLLGGSRIISLTTDNDNDGEGYDSHRAQQAQSMTVAGQVDYAQEFASSTSYLLTSPGVVYSQPNFNQVRQLNATDSTTGQKAIGLPTTASKYAMSLRHSSMEPDSEQAANQLVGKRAPSMVTEFAQYLAEQKKQQSYKLPYLISNGDEDSGGADEANRLQVVSKPPLHPSAQHHPHQHFHHTSAQSSSSSAASHNHNPSRRARNSLDGSVSVAGFNDDFFRAIPVVEESGLDDASVMSKDSFQRGAKSADRVPRRGSIDSEDQENNLPLHHLRHPQHQARRKHSPGTAAGAAAGNGSSLTMSPSMLDLRADILSFMAKANSQMTHEYGGYLDPQLSKPHASMRPHKQNASTIIYESTKAAEFAGSGASIVSQGSIQSTLPEEHRHLAKLWDQLRNRYAGDHEGAKEMKQKIRNYIQHGIKEENQVTRAYMEEMEDW